MSDGEPEPGEDTTRHRRHASLDNLKLTANSVTELRDFFELLSRKNAERESAGGGRVFITCNQLAPDCFSVCP